MNKLEFLGKLEKGLRGLPDDVIDSTVDYYSEMIDDRVEAGEDEAEAVAEIGNIDEIVSRTLSEIPLPKLMCERVIPKKKLTTLSLVLIIIGSPVWLSLGVAAAAIIFAVYVSLWSVVVSLCAVFVSVAAMVPYSILAAVLAFARGGALPGAAWIGVGLVCAGLAVLLFMAAVMSVKVMISTGKKIWLWIKSLFVKKGDK